MRAALSVVRTPSLRSAAGGLLLALLLAGCGSSSGGNKSSSAPAPPSTAASTATPATSASKSLPGPAGATGQTVDGIRCETTEQVVYHIHAHLAVYIDGTAGQVPYGIGIVPPGQVEQSTEGPFVVSGKCFYWLHSHTQDGVIHIESPTARVYTLGNYFDEWMQPLSRTQVATATGPVTAFVNGRRYTGDLRQIPLLRHELIQLDVGSPVVPPQGFKFPAGL